MVTELLVNMAPMDQMRHSVVNRHTRIRMTKQEEGRKEEGGEGEDKRERMKCKSVNIIETIGTT